VTLGDLAKYSVMRSVVWFLCCSWATGLICNISN